LKLAVERSGVWGAVRIVPDDRVTDVTVTGEVLSSTPSELEIEIRVFDARGKKWLRKRYQGEGDENAYRTRGGERDPFQDLYEQIADDILEKREKQSDSKIARLPELALLRFAAALVPDLFGDYLVITRKGRFEARRLPAMDDPMWQRVIRIRTRDEMFIDILESYHGALVSKMKDPYDAWRARGFQLERLAHGLRKRGRSDKLLGAGILVGGIIAAAALDDDDDDDVDPEAALVGTMAVAAGDAMMERGENQSVLAHWYEEDLRELARSLDFAVEPTVVWFEGESMRFTGSMEAQYAKWKSVLRELYLSEKDRASR
jgi:hypothetical protein